MKHLPSEMMIQSPNEQPETRHALSQEASSRISPSVAPAPMVGRLDERLLHLLAILFPEPALHGVEFLAHLCRRATERQDTLFPGQAATSVAVITCQGIPDLLAQPEWKWDRETTLIMLQALEALTVLVRFRRARRTEIHIPLGKRPPIDPSLLLKRLKHATATYANAKTRRLLNRLSARLQQAWPQISQGTGDFVEKTAEPASLAVPVQEGVLTLLTDEGVPAPICKRISFRLALAAQPISHTVAARQHGSPDAPRPTNEAQVVSSPVVPSRPEQGVSYREQEVAAGETKRSISPGDCKDGRRRSKTERELSQETTRETDSQSTQPSAVAMPDDVETLRREEDESPTDYHDRSEGESGERTLKESEMEARAIWKQLLTPEQRQLPGAARQLRQIAEYVEAQSELARSAMVNVLMQRVFPDRHGTPAGMGWFVNTYRLYTAGKLPISPEIAGWVCSPSSYEQIEAALWAERRRQERLLELPRRPDVSCLEDTPYLDDDTPLITASYEAREQQESDEDRHVEHEPSADAQQSHLIEERTPRQAVSDSKTLPSVKEPAQYIIPVAAPDIGWRDQFGAQWWEEKLRATPLARSCTIEVWPTQYERFVLLLTPNDDPNAAWIWGTGHEVRFYLEEQRDRNKIRQQKEQTFSSR